jgi:hypothetical protein
MNLLAFNPSAMQFITSFPLATGVYQLLQVAILVAAVAAMSLLNWHASKAFFKFRNRCRSHVLIFLYGSAAILIGVVAPFFVIAYLALWVFDWLPSRIAGYLTAIAEIVWGVATLAVIVRHSAKYWTNRSYMP